MKTAFLEANHWHLRPHTAALKKSTEVKLVGLSGKGLLPEEISKDMEAPLYDDYNELLDKEAPDFVYIFGTCRQTPSIIKNVVERGIPFIAEKPCAINSEDLIPIIAEVKKKKIVNSVPLGRRFSPIVERYLDMTRESAERGQLHFVFRYITGTPYRYSTLGCAWGLDPFEAGGGCLMNLGHHYVDLVRYITQDEIVSVKAVMHSNIWDTEVDDYASLLLQTKKGSTATIEVGFTNPSDPYELYNMTGKGFYIAGEPTKEMVCYRDDAATERFDFPRSDYYEECLHDMVLSVKGLKQPKISLEDQCENLKIINKAYKDAERR